MIDTEYMLKRGELQRLAFELLPRMNHEWDGLIHSGAVEGTHKPRKGTPDMWKESDEGNLIYVQVTTDSNSEKFMRISLKVLSNFWSCKELKVHCV